LKCDGTRTETRFHLSAKRTSPFKSEGASVQPTTGNRGVRISGSNAGYTMLRGSVNGTGYPLHPPVSRSLPLPCVTVCHHISTGLYKFCTSQYGSVALKHCLLIRYTCLPLRVLALPYHQQACDHYYCLVILALDGVYFKLYFHIELLTLILLTWRIW